MAAIVKCRNCRKRFDAKDAANVGTRWHIVAQCPACGVGNPLVVGDGGLDIDGIISQAVDNKYEAKKRAGPLEERVHLNAVLEYWVQQYIAANFRRLGFKELRGPFESGPDFKVLYRGEWVWAEAEVVCENYILHKHHQNPKWTSCKILIALDEKEPDPKAKEFLPKTIIRIDKKHFLKWYRPASSEYAQARQREEPMKKAAEKVELQLRVLANEIRERFGVPSSEDGGNENDMLLFDELAFEFVERWMTGNELKLAKIPPAAIDEFCSSISPFVHEHAENLPVFDSLYCEACDITLVIRSTRLPGFSDFENVICPNCRTNLGNIRADMGFQIVEKKKGNYGNTRWQGAEYERKRKRKGR